MLALYAEDDDALREDFADVLRHFFPDLLVAKDGVEAKKLYDTYTPALIITDISMPMLDGLSLAHHIKTNDPLATVIITTGFNTTHHLTRAIDVHVDKFLVKPIDYAKLKDFMQELIPMVHHKYQHSAPKKSEDLLMRFLSHTISIGICISDDTGSITQYNRCLVEMFGYDIHELKNKKFTTLFTEEDQEVVEILYSECFKTGTGEEMPIKWKALKKDGSPLYLSITASLFKTTEGKTFLFSTIQDITSLVTIEQLEHEQELLILKKRLQM